MSNESTLPKKELIIGIILKDNSILMRKKPQGSLPYQETWYLFGCEKKFGQNINATFKEYILNHIGIEIAINDKLIPSTSEIKKDHDGIEKEFIYTNLSCTYLSGVPKTPPGAERVEWITKDILLNYDIVPPSKDLFKTLGYL